MIEIHSTGRVRAFDCVRTRKHADERRLHATSAIRIRVRLERSGNSLVSETYEPDLQRLAGGLHPRATLNCLISRDGSSVCRHAWNHHDVAKRRVLLARELEADASDASRFLAAVFSRPVPDQQCCRSGLGKNGHRCSPPAASCGRERESEYDCSIDVFHLCAPPSVSCPVLRSCRHSPKASPASVTT